MIAYNPSRLTHLLCVALLALLSACSERRPAGASGDSNGGGVDAPPGDPCAKVREGCPCDTEEVSECGTVKEERGPYVICSKGQRTCNDGKWGACVAIGELEKLKTFAAPMQGGFSLQGLGTTQNCNNLCDPECEMLQDTPSGLVVPSDLYASPTGVTLPGGTHAGTCSNITVTPPVSTITITAIAADGSITASPATAQFQSVCSNGAPVQASWTIDAYDRAVITSNGVVTPYSGVAGPITVTGASSTDSKTATLNIKVALEDRGSSTTTATAFDLVSVLADSANTLYPYKNTVFPLDLESPLVQWDRGSTFAGSNTATDVQVQLRFPKGCTPGLDCTFFYSKIFNGTEPTCTSAQTNLCLSTSQPAWKIPQNVWSVFDHTAAGSAVGGEIVIQRRYGGTVKKDLSIPVKFATDSLKGTVYYTQYKRFLTSSSCPSSGTNARVTSSYVPGAICPVGPCIQGLAKGDATTRSIDLSSTTAVNNDPFSGTAGCPVCHAISADGGRHVSVGQNTQSTGGGTSKGINDIGSSGGSALFNGVGLAPQYTNASSSGDANNEQSYGLAYGAMSPDGSRVFQGSNYWGNTDDIPSGGNNTQSAPDLGLAGLPKPYFYVNTDLPGAGVQLATTGPLPSSTFSGGVITASANSALGSIDGVSTATNRSILVKDETATARNGVYTVTNAGSGSAKWVLTRRGDLNATGELVSQMEVRVTDGVSNRGQTYYVANTGTITMNTTGITFARRAHAPLNFSNGASALYATTGILSPGTVTQSGTKLIAGYPGALVVDGATVSLNDVVLVKDQVTQSQNGPYRLVTAPAGGVGAPASIAYATTTALPANTRSAMVLNPSALGALTVDGTVLAVNSVVLVKDEATNVNNGVYTLNAQGSGSASVATISYATAAALPANTRTNNILNATSYGPLSVDGTTLSMNDTVLVKDEATQANNGVYTVTQLGNGTSTSTTATRGTTAALPTSTATATVITGSASGGLTVDGGAVVAGDVILVKNEVATVRNGIYTVTTAGAGGTGTANAVNYTTTAALAGTRSTNVINASAFGPLVVDGVNVAANDTILVKNQAASVDNGVYTVNQAGNGSATVAAANYASTAALGVVATATTLTDTTFDGPLVLDGATPIVGDVILIKDQATGSQNGIYQVTTQGTGSTTVVTAALATAAALPTHGATTTVLTASANGALSIDGTTPAVNAVVLVKNETTTSRNGIYTVTTVGNASTAWRLTRHTSYDALGEIPYGLNVSVTAGATNVNKGFYLTAPTSPAIITPGVTGLTFGASSKWLLTRHTGYDAVGDIPLGMNVSVASGTANGGAGFYVSAPTTGSITPGTTAMTFAASTKWQMTRHASYDAAGEMTGAMQFVASAGATNAAKTHYISTPSSGSVTPNTTAISFTLAQPWVLTRHTSYDAAGEMTPAMHVQVTSGTANTGLGFYITAPASGTITPGTSAISFGSSARWQLTRHASYDGAGELTGGMTFRISAGAANLNKSFYISTPASGAITVNTTAMAFTQATSWQLTRHASYDAVGEITPLMQFGITSGTANAGKTFYVSTPASGSITPNTTAIGFSLGTSWELQRLTTADEAGEILPGGDVAITGGVTNSGRGFYVSTPTTGTITPGTTALAYSQSGMPTMMVPAFSPNGTKLVYINGDADIVGGLAPTGWRRGLTVMDFAWNATTSTYAVSNKKRLYNTYNSSTAGTVLKWPFFEGDNRSVIYMETAATDFCSSSDVTSTTPNTDQLRACSQGSLGSAIGARGNMTPTTRGYFAGRLFSIDSGAANPSGTRVELSKLNDADDDGGADDAVNGDRSYQPTVLPGSAGGYRWVIFTSTRAFGNQVNPKSYASATFGTATHFTCASPMLWMSGLTDTTANGTDRSSPAFLLPGQYVAQPTASNDYINERGYLVPSPCKNDGESCSTDEDCCGADQSPATAACRAPTNWTPASGPPVRTCEELSGTCNNSGESCSVDADCCNGVTCVNFACSAPANFEAATFTREYVADCGTGQHPNWQLFSFHLTTDLDSKIQFTAQSSKSLDTLDAAKVVTLGESTATTVSPATPAYLDVGGLLEQDSVSRHLTYVRVNIRLVPSSDGSKAPVLHDWEMRYTCEDGE
jgi:hypothetical protein